MIDDKQRLGRRHFLLTVGAGGVATAAALVAEKSATRQDATADRRRATRGYHVTEHVRRYYETAKV